MDKGETININVIIADRPYRLKIAPDEEEVIRRAAKKINDQIKDLQNTYDAKDKQDYMAMSLLLNTTDLLKLQQEIDQEDKDFAKHLTQLDELLSGALLQAE